MGAGAAAVVSGTDLVLAFARCRGFDCAPRHRLRRSLRHGSH